VGIGGVILRLWRVGDRYDSIATGIGGIFYTMPYFDVLAPILVLDGAHSAQHKLKSTEAQQKGTF
jgi:hypothetical protein